MISFKIPTSTDIALFFCSGTMSVLVALLIAISLYYIILGGMANMMAVYVLIIIFILYWVLLGKWG